MPVPDHHGAAIRADPSLGKGCRMSAKECPSQLILENRKPLSYMSFSAI
jgi:hypothetical protein